MKNRQIGNSGIYISEIGLGCMSLPDDLMESKKIVNTALDAGINYFDTADLYNGGKNEAILGELLKDKRSQIILATKVGNKLNDSGEGWTWDSSKEHIMNAVKKSLSRLKTDYIDVYQLHGGTMDDAFMESIEAFETLKKEGIIRQFGISSIRPNVIKRFLQNSSAISVMMQYSLLDRRPEEWLPMIQENDASVISRGTLAKGLLTKQGFNRVRTTKGFVDYSSEELIETIELLNERTDNLHAAAIAYTLQNPTIASAVIGASSSLQLLDSIGAYDTKVSVDTLKEISMIVKPNKYDEHRQ